jgi:diguanylate cyclase (GGDEF)-like protein
MKILVIMVLNWLIAILGLSFIFSDYTNTYVSINSLYSKYFTTIILYNLLKKLADVDKPKDMYEQILEAAAKAIPKATFGSLMMEKNGKMVFEASFGFNHDYLELIELDVRDTAFYKSTNGKMDRPVIISDIVHTYNETTIDVKQDIFVKAGVDKIRSSICAPITIDKKFEGSLNLDSTEVNYFKQSDIDVLELFALEIGKFVQLYQTLELNRTLSRYDALTGIFNRGYCTQFIKKLMEEQSEFILVSVDLNNLKEVNDMYGHEIGDLLIKNYVNNIRLFLPDDVTFSRYGGDEFVFVFPKTEEVKAHVVMDDASNYFENHTISNVGPKVSISFCYGISQFPKEAENYDKLLKIADERMYKQKRKYKKKLGLK